MEREIKFRAWNGEKMLYSHNNIVNDHYFQLRWFFEKVHETDDLMQFTGLLDKHGKEIYECDVVSTRHVFVPKGLIAFRQGSFEIKNIGGEEEIYIKHKEWNNVEVIGNIYETPELLSTSQIKQ